MVVKRYVLFFIGFFCSLFSFSQNVIVNRIEGSEDTLSFYGCIPFGEQGMLLKAYYPEKNSNRKIDVFTYEKFDTAFHKKNSVDVAIPAKKSAYLDYTSSTHQYNLAYQTSGTYSVSIVSVADMKTWTIHGKFPKNTTIHSMRAAGEYVYLLGYTKDLPIMVCHNITTNAITFGKIIPLTKRKFSIVSFEVNDATEELYLFTKDEVKNDKLVKMYVYKNGVKTFERMLVSTDADKYIVSAFASRLHDNSFLISGTYGTSSKNSEVSVGIFISKMSPEGETTFTKFINYLDIQNFTSYLSARKQEKIEKKQERKQSQNKELELNYLMVPHNIIEQDGNFVLIGEAYYPTYRQECQYMLGPNGQTMYCYPVFDGYQYTHFFLLEFNEQGVPLWSNAAPMEIENKPYYVKRFLSINSKPDTVIQLGYSTWRDIFLYNFKDGEKVGEETISFVNDDEKLIQSSTQTRHWYGDVFLSYGIQKIKNKEKERREVYFIEKLQIPIQ